MPWDARWAAVDWCEAIAVETAREGPSAVQPDRAVGLVAEAVASLVAVGPDVAARHRDNACVSRADPGLWRACRRVPGPIFNQRLLP